MRFDMITVIKFLAISVAVIVPHSSQFTKSKFCRFDHLIWTGEANTRGKVE